MGSVQIKTDDPGTGFDSLKEWIRDCVADDKVNKRASPAYYKNTQGRGTIVVFKLESFLG